VAPTVTSAFAQRPAHDRDLEPLMIGQRQRDRRARRDDIRAQVVAQRSGELERGRAAIEHDDLAVANASGGTACDRRLCLRRAPRASCKRRGVTVARERATVDAPQQPGVVELAQIPPNRVSGDRQLGGQVGSEHAALRPESLEDQRAPLVGQHFRESTRLCTFMHDHV
jgi:hypothetical protein